MGKAALLIAFGATLFVAQGMLSQNETERHTAQTQAGFEEGVIAREIARTGFNVAMGKLREHNNNIHAAIAQINSNGGNRYLRGESQGGTYRVRVELKDGNTVQVTSIGYFGGEFVDLGNNEDPEPGWCRLADPFTGDYYTGACHTMSDNSSPLYEYERPSGDPLTAKLECSQLDVTFLESQAGYCSAIYLQRTLPDSETPEVPEMLFLPGRNRDGANLSSVSKYIRGGTQMNFFIGVDENCSTQSLASTVEDFPEFTGNLNNPSPYDHLHYALTEEVGAPGEMTETPWAFTEVQPDIILEEGGTSIQRWRVAWEDQNVTSWANSNSDDPRTSLHALKRLGYDGNGWPDEDEHGYRTLRDYGDRPDFSDQVVEVELVEQADASLCIPTAEEEPIAELPTSEEPSTEEPSTEEPVPADPVNCPCPQGNNNKKVFIRHMLPGAAANDYQEICVSENAWPAHARNHNDHQICTGV